MTASRAVRALGMLDSRKTSYYARIPQSTPAVYQKIYINSHRKL
jgi:hypothetical protein